MIGNELVAEMEIVVLHSLTESQLHDVQGLIKELVPGLCVSRERLAALAAAPGNHFFAAVEDDGHIVGCATLCVFDTPTGRKASVEDVVVNPACRGQHIGRKLMEHIIDFARHELGDVDLHLTSSPRRVAANNLYRAVGFQQRETNVYNMEIKGSVVSRLREFVENEGRSCSMDLAGITPEYVYRMWGGTVALEEIAAGLKCIRNNGGV